MYTHYGCVGAIPTQSLMTLIWLKDRNFVLEVTLYHGVLLRGIPWYDCLACILLSLVSRDLTLPSLHLCIYVEDQFKTT